jgi:uncharacterized membrane protein
MQLLITGLVLWVLIHLFPCVCKNTRATLIEKIGLKPYKGIFAITIIASVLLIVLGWQGTTPKDIYYPASWSRHVTFTLVLITFILFAAAKSKTNIKRVLRHPQLTGLVFWSIGHLIVNGDNRSVILFGTLGIWAILEMFMISIREGAWQKPEPVPIKKDVITVVAGVVVYVVFMFLHPFITGMKLM